MADLIKKRQNAADSGANGNSGSSVNESDLSSSYANAMSNAGTTGTSSATGTSSNTLNPTSHEDYDDLREQNYKNLLDNQIQLAAARQAAMKSSRMQMAAQGMAGTGYAGVVSNGLQNAYINAMNSANQSYHQTGLDIDANERKANEQSAENRFQNLTSMLSQAQNVDDMDMVLKNYGISKNDDGTLYGGLYDSMSDDDKRQLSTLYTMMANQTRYGGNSYGDAADMINNLTMANGEKANQGSGYGLQYEINYLFSNADQYAKDGMVVKLTNGKASDTNVAYVIYRNGKWYATTSSEYGSAKNKAEIKDGRPVR